MTLKRIFPYGVILLLLPSHAAMPAGRAVAFRQIADGAFPNLPPVKEVDPLIGTSDTTGGNVFPGASMPFGMIQWSPDTSSGFGPHQPASYVYEDHGIRDFSLNHLSGPGCPVFGDFPIMPVPGALNFSPAAHSASLLASFAHNGEKASPGFYSVSLGTGVFVELTVTMRSGLGRLTFPHRRSAEGTVLVSTGRDATGVRASSVRILGNNRLDGQVTSGGFCGSHNRYTVYFAGEFNHPFASFGTWKDHGLHHGSRTAGGPGSGAYVTFDTSQDRTVEMKVALSYVSIQDAWLNMQDEIHGWDFNAVRQAASAAWSRDLGRILVQGGKEDNLWVFYTALYHALLQPNVFSDANGKYIGFDNRVHTAHHHVQYANFSGWDIYRSQIQLLALLHPRRTSDMIQSLLADAAQGGGGLPIWPVANDDSCVMVGAPSYPIIANAYAFRARGFDAHLALQIMLRGATPPGARCKTCTEYPHLSDYLKYGYYSPDEHSGPSETLEFGAADFSLSRLAKALGDSPDYIKFTNRAQAWENTFNRATGYIEPRHNDGSFLSGFKPASDRHFVEGNAAQYTFEVPWDFERLLNLLGGPQQAIHRLDALFTHLNAGAHQPYFWMGNEPGFDIPWAYDFAGEPWQTQQVVRRIETQLFTVRSNGIPGNDDLGAMSSWYVFAAMGLYPEIPGVGGFCLDSPLFSQVIWRLGNGSTVLISGQNAGNANPYVRNLTLNGARYPTSWLPYSKIEHGATVVFLLGSSPYTPWGSAVDRAPPSFGRVP
jgi:predicted alpha-1,2-mannosidase